MGKCEQKKIDVLSKLTLAQRGRQEKNSSHIVIAALPEPAQIRPILYSREDLSCSARERDFSQHQLFYLASL